MAPCTRKASEPGWTRVQSSGRSNTSVVGTFKANGTEFTCESQILTIRATNVRISPVPRATDNGPSHRVFSVEAEVGAAWSRRSKEGRTYLSVRLDDPSLLASVYASLLADENGKGHNLVWSRASSAAASERLRRPQVGRRKQAQTGSAVAQAEFRPPPEPDPGPACLIHAARLHREVPHSTFDSVPGEGHMIHQTATARVMAAIDTATGR